MANGSFRVKSGSLNIKSGTSGSESGDITVNSNKVEFHNGSSASPMVTEAHAASLTNKTIDADVNTLSNIVNASIKAGAAIAYSKLNLAASIVNADVASGAAIDYAKLALSGSIVNADINASAAIAYSKLNLATSIVNGDISASAAIAYSKLSLANSIVNADIGASAAIAYSKLSLGNSIVNSDIGAAAAIAYSKLNLSNSIVNADIAAGAAIAVSKINTGLSGSLVGTTDTQTLTNKTIGDALVLTEVASPSTPSSGTVKVYPKSDKKLYFKDSLGAERAVGAGTGSINYVTNPDAEGDTTGWATYADADAATPADGTGGSAGITLTRSTSSPLRGTASFLITKAASSSHRGQGVSYDFTIDTADQANVLALEMDYEPSSGFTAGDSSDINVYIYDVTNSALIQPVPYTIQGGSGGKQKFKSTFQAAPNSTSYRLILHVATVSTTAWTFKFDNVKVGPQSVNATERVVAARYRIAAAQTMSSGTLAFASKIHDTHAAMNAAGTTFTAPISGYYKHSITWATSSQAMSANDLISVRATKNGTAAEYVAVYRAPAAGTALRSASGTVTYWMNAGDTFSWSVVNNISVTFENNGDTNWWDVERIATQGVADDGRIVAARYGTATADSFTSGSARTINYDVKYVDTHNAVTTGTAGAWKFTAPISGIYRVDARCLINVTSGTGSVFFIELYKDGSVYSELASVRGWNGQQYISLHGTTLVQLNAGQYIQVPLTTGVTGGLHTNAVNNHISIERVTGAASVSASESVSARYKTSAAQSIPNGVVTILDMASKDWDTHSMYTAGAGYNSGTGTYSTNPKFTAPMSGKYRITVNLLSGSTTVAAGNILTIPIYKNGVWYSEPGYRRIEGALTSTEMWLKASDVLNLNAGDYVDARIWRNNGGSLSLINDDHYNFITFERIGN